MFADIVQRLKDPAAHVRNAAEKELWELARVRKGSVAEARFLIAHAADEFPTPTSALSDVGASILYVVRQMAADLDPDQLIPDLEAVFARLTPRAKEAALQTVVQAETVRAARFYVRCLAEHSEELADEHIMRFRASVGPEAARALFPALLGVARGYGPESASLLMLLEFRKAELIPATIAAEHEPRIAERLEGALAEARTLQRPHGLGWRDDDPYGPLRDRIGLIFDVAGMLDAPRLLNLLQASGDLLDPRLRRFRAVSLLRRGHEVGDDELEWIARSPRDRYWLFTQLVELGLEERLPELCHDQAALAEGAMVDWLCFPTELGREPDEIELIHRETRRQSTGPRIVSWLRKRKLVDYYFFKFRVTEQHWAKKDGWMVGMAGGYARDEQPTTSHDGGTFSTFGKFGEKSVAEHVAGYLDG